MSCYRCHQNTCTCDQNCGCNPSVKGKCVFYRGATLTCLGEDITTGMNYDAILAILVDSICGGISNPSGHVYTVIGTSNEINVSNTTIGNVTTYQVSLSNTIKDEIADIQSDIASLQTCCDASIKEITTNTPFNLLITDEGSGTWNIDFQNPSGNYNYDGIVYNDTTAATLPAGSGTTVVVKTFNRNYVSQNNISDNDEIKFQFTGKIQAGVAATDSLIVELFDATTLTVLASVNLGSFNTNGISSYVIDGILDVISVGSKTGLLTVRIERNNVDNGTTSDLVRAVANINQDVTNINYNNLTIRLKQNNISSVNSVDNRCRKFTVEVRKYIG